MKIVLPPKALFCAARIALLLLLGLAPPAAAQGGFASGKLREREDRETFLAPPAQNGVAEGYWQVTRDVQLAHFAAGKGEPVLFLHGGPGFPPASPLPGLSLLEDRFRFHYYHQRGCGKSTRPFDRFGPGSFPQHAAELVGKLGIAQQIADVERIRRVLGEEKLTLVGHSFGGFIAALYAAEFPERVAKLVLVAPADMLKMPNPGGGIFEAIKDHLPEGEIRDEYAGYLIRFFQGFGTAFTKSEAELVALNREFGRYFAAAIEAQGLSAEAASAPEGLDGGWMPFGIYFSLGMQYDLTPALAGIACPVLIIHGEKDFSLGPAALDAYQDHLKHAVLETIPGAGHFVFHDRPQEIARVIGRFLGEGE